MWYFYLNRKVWKTDAIMQSFCLINYSVSFWMAQLEFLIIEGKFKTNLST